MNSIRDSLSALGIFYNNEYYIKYCDLIESNSNNIPVRGVTQRHHIVPKYYFKRVGKKVDNSKNNIVNLKYSDHILAHYYLSLCCCYKEDRLYNFLFLRFVLYGKNNDKYKNVLELDNSLLEKIQREYNEMYTLKRAEKHLKFLKKKEDELSQWISECHRCKKCGKIMTYKYGRGIYCSKQCAASHNHSDKTKALLSKLNKDGVCGNKGKKFTKEHRDKISQANRGKKRTPDQVRTMSEARKGQTPWNKGLTKDDDRVNRNIRKRNETMMKKYGTLNVYAIAKNSGGNQ